MSEGISSSDAFTATQWCCRAQALTTILSRAHLTDEGLLNPPPNPSAKPESTPYAMFWGVHIANSKWAPL